jgi:hypothetical protein
VVEDIEQDARVSLNVRIDSSKFAVLEQLRTTGFGLAKTSRNRSDVYNEVLGYGLQTLNLRNELGDRDFEKIWKILHKLNAKHLNWDKILKMVE